MSCHESEKSSRTQSIPVQVGFRQRGNVAEAGDAKTLGLAELSWRCKQRTFREKKTYLAIDHGMR